MNRYITNDVIAEVMRLCKGKCVHCGSEVKLQLGHLIPFSKGGNNSVSNLIIECEDCNKTKGIQFLPTKHIKIDHFAERNKIPKKGTFSYLHYYLEKYGLFGEKVK